MLRKAFFFFAFIVTFSSKAQSPNFNVNFPSPNAASLGLHGEVPVSLHTGVPQISIPLYEIKEGSISVPISLSYHAAGIRPDVHPGWVGNGWSLNAGGMITRVVKGIADEAHWEKKNYYEDDNKTIKSLTYQVGHIYNSLLKDANWNTPDRINYLAKRRSGDDSNPDYYQDTEPDEFVFNFNGYSGSFILDEDHNIKVIGHPEIQVRMQVMKSGYPFFKLNKDDNKPITYRRNNVTGNIGASVYEQDIKINAIIVKTPDGLEYEFGKWDLKDASEASVIEASINFFQQIYIDETWDTWYLREIRSLQGHKVTFTYNAPEGNAIASFGNTIAIEKTAGSTTPRGIFKRSAAMSVSSSELSQYYEGRIIYPCYLAKITTSNEEIDFKTLTTNELTYNYSAILKDLNKQAEYSFDSNFTLFRSPRSSILAGKDQYGTEILDFSAFKWKQLENIIIKNKLTSEEFNRWTFSYTSDPSVRLTLNKIVNQAVSDNKIVNQALNGRIYLFKYNESQTLPAYNSYQTDHWGFFNGKTPNFGDFSNSYLTNFYQDKEPNTDPSFGKAGILEKITYPTGGYTTFDYEQNQYSAKVIREQGTGNFSLQKLTSPKIAGGLRIREIKSYDSDGTLELFKSYKYEGGILSGEAQYFWENYSGKFINGNIYTGSRFVSQTILPVSKNSFGSHIGYSKVIEKLEGNGYTEFYFTNYERLDDRFLATIDPQKSRYSPFSSRSAERGLLYQKLVYQEGNTKPIQKEYLYYPTTPDLNLFIRATQTKQIPVLGGITVEGSSYKIYNYPYKAYKIKESKHNLEDDTSIEQVKNYVYDNTFYNLLKEEKVSLSSGQSNIIEYKYPADYNIADVVTSTDPHVQALKKMQLANIISNPIEELNWVEQSGQKKLIGATYSLYKDFGTSGGVQLERVEKLPVSVPIASSAFTPSGIDGNLNFTKDSRYQPKLFFKQYDEKGNALEVQEASAPTDAYLWGYSKNLPIAEVKNASQNVVLYDGFEDKQGWSGMEYDTEQKRTGTVSGRIINSTATAPEKRVHNNHWLDVNLTAPKRFKYSGWVYSNGPSAEIFLFMKKDGETEYFTQVDRVETTIKDKWVHLEKEFDVPAGIRYLGLRLDNNGTGTVWFDDVRLHPADAMMTTYTYDPLIGLTSSTDANGRTTHYEYDGFGRLQAVKDEQGNILKTYEYNYRK